MELYESFWLGCESFVSNLLCLRLIILQLLRVPELDRWDWKWGSSKAIANTVFTLTLWSGPASFNCNKLCKTKPIYHLVNYPPPVLCVYFCTCVFVHVCVCARVCVLYFLDQTPCLLFFFAAHLKWGWRLFIWKPANINDGWILQILYAQAHLGKCLIFCS